MEERLFENYIIKSVSGFYYVETASGILECRARGLFRQQGMAPVAGDFVVVQKGNIEGEVNLITELMPRTTFLQRPPVANLNKLFLITATKEPAPNFLVMDTLLAIAVNSGITPVIVVTKTDLASDNIIVSHYAGSTIKTIAVGQSGAGISEIETEIKGNICAFSGNSGVGKSTLLNKLAPGLGLATAGISHKLGRGKHTTRQVELFKMHGGLVADTPGFSALEMAKGNVILKAELQYTFPEFKNHIPACRFTGCTHRSEKGCAVRSAVESGYITKTRYESYLALYAQADKFNEWEI